MRCLMSALMTLLFVATVWGLDTDEAVCTDRTADGEARIAACTRLVDAQDDGAALVEALRQRAQVYRDLDMPEEAIADYGRAIEIDPDDPRLYRSRGIVYFNRRNYEAAADDFTSAIGLEPRNSWNYRVRGLTYRRVGRDEDALADFDRAVEINPREVMNWRERAAFHRDAGAHERAIADYDEALKLTPFHSESYYHRGSSHERLGALSETLRDYKVMELLDPNTYCLTHPVRTWFRNAFNSGPPAAAAPSAYASPLPGLQVRYLEVHKTVEILKAEAELQDGISQLQHWFASCPEAPLPERKRFILTEIISAGDGRVDAEITMQAMEPQPGQLATNSASYFRGLLPKEQPIPGMVVEMTHDGEALDRLWPLEAGKSISGTSVFQFQCPEDMPAQQATFLGCEPGGSADAGGSKWRMRVTGWKRGVVAAGAFDVYVIEQYETADLIIAGRSLGQQSRSTTWWYAPSINWWVRRETDFGAEGILIREAVTIEHAHAGHEGLR